MAQSHEGIGRRSEGIANGCEAVREKERGETENERGIKRVWIYKATSINHRNNIRLRTANYGQSDVYPCLAPGPRRDAPVDVTGPRPGIGPVPSPPPPDRHTPPWSGTTTMPLSTASSSTLTAATARPSTSGEHYPPPPPSSSSRIPVTPAVLRGIFASSRTILEERSLSRVAFFRYGPIFYAVWEHGQTQPPTRFTGFVLSCLTISLLAARNRGIKAGAGLLGVGVV